MREKFEKLSIEREPEEKPGLTFLKEEIKKLIKEFSAETFKEAKKEKTEEIGIGEKVKEGIIKEYPGKVYDFREKDWFKKLTPEEREKTEFKIMNSIHKIARKEMKGLYNKFLEKLPSQVQKYCKENERKRKREKEPVLPPKELEEEVINATEEYKKQFGFPPGEPQTLRFDCATFTNFLGKLFEHYGFKNGPVSVPGHVGLLVELKGNKRYVSDVYLPKPLILRKWIKEMIKERKIKIGDITIGSFGGYESDVHDDFGTFLQNLKRHEKAEKEFREAIEKNSNNPRAHNNLGALLYGLGKKRFPEAEKEFRKAIEIKPNYGVAHYNLGFLYGKMEKIDKAREELLRARELFKKDERIEYVKKCDGTLKKISESH